MVVCAAEDQEAAGAVRLEEEATAATLSEVISQETRPESIIAIMRSPTVDLNP